MRNYQDNIMKLSEGAYENLINNSLEDDIKEASNNNLVCKTEDIDSAESSLMFAEYLAEIIRKKLEDDEVSTEDKVKIINGILSNVQAPNEEILINTDQKLSAVIKKEQEATLQATGKELIRPISGFRVSNLFTGGQSALSLHEEIQRDIASADQICFIVSFLKMSGIRLLIEPLRKFCSQEGHSLRIITTTYCGVTEGKAVEQLSELPNTEIRISYNTKIERLHAKAYIFVRNSGLSTAFIGSSNLSHSAQTDGLEWNIRVTNVENPHIIKSALASFNMYWDSQNFEDFNIGGIEKFNRETKAERSANSINADTYQRYTVLPHQQVILNKLKAERENNDIYKNLIVAATGTGKTVVSAFDYQIYKRNNTDHCRLLFVAHREEILKQAIRTYRSVLKDVNFADIWVGDCHPQGSPEYLFVSVQTLNSQKAIFEKLGSHYYDYVVIDEAHHIVADSYREIIKLFEPKILLGLTATPERMDGESLLPDFCNKISAEIRLPKALEEGLLTPFQYLCITDPTDLRSDDLWEGEKYIKSKLSDKLCYQERVELIVQKLKEYLNDENKCRALCFCTDKRHAEFMRDQFRLRGYKAESLTSNNDEDRERLNKALSNGDINYLFVVDMFNEGVDIPEVDTVLFLRPTESLTIFLQQLGRGLRLSPGKEYLTVFDFVAQVNKQYDFNSRFRALCLKQDRSVSDQVKNGFTLLPNGCSIMMEQKAQQIILDNISNAIYNIPRLVAELRTYQDCPSLSQFIENNGQDIRLLYRSNNCWSKLKKLAGKCNYQDDSYTQKYEKGLGNLVHINSLAYLKFIQKYLDNNCTATPTTASEKKFAVMLYYALYQEKAPTLGFSSIYDALHIVNRYPMFKQEIQEIKNYLFDNLDIKTFDVGKDMPEGLEQYGCYTREEIFTLFGRQTPERTMHGNVSGVFNIDELNTELFFVTLNKSDKDFSPSTQYDDYVISEARFHWQSQNNDSHNGKGKRFVQQAQNGKKFVLFVRENKKDGFGNTCPFYCFGLVDYIRSDSDFPMNIEWQFEEPAMPQFVKAV